MLLFPGSLTTLPALELVSHAAARSALAKGEVVHRAGGCFFPNFPSPPAFAVLPRACRATPLHLNQAVRFALAMGEVVQRTGWLFFRAGQIRSSVRPTHLLF